MNDKELDEKIRKLKEDFNKEISSSVEKELGEYKVKVSDLIRRERNLEIKYSFVLEDGYAENGFGLWNYDEDILSFTQAQKNTLEYIKKLRNEFPIQTIQHDYIQKNREYKKELKIVHSGYNQNSFIRIELCGYLKLPNTTNCSCGGGDYQIKRTPERVRDFKDNIDRTIDSLLDVISDLKKLKNEVPTDTMKP